MQDIEDNYMEMMDKGDLRERFPSFRKTLKGEMFYGVQENEDQEQKVTFKIKKFKNSTKTSEIIKEHYTEFDSTTYTV